MRIHHVGVVCRSEEDADRFYRDLLGLEKIRSFFVSVALSQGLFGLDRGFPAHTYGKGDLAVEVFVIEEGAVTHPHLHHTGLEVDDLKTFLQKCRDLGVQIMEVAKKEKIVTMIKDFDGNLFEIKEKA
jgi:catechol 2,3-dioxygenase-like lactoylglutathione lyase family enzyme